MKTDWMAEAACADSDLDFYGYTNDNAAGQPGESVDWAVLGALIEVCNRCPVIRDCATFSMRQDAIEQYGVWAGTTATQRLRIARAHDPIGNAISFAKENLAESRRRSSQTQLEGVA